MNVSVEALQLYTRCSLAWFYEMRAGVARPRTPSTLVGKSISAALVQFYTGAAGSLTAAAGAGLAKLVRRVGRTGYFGRTAALCQRPGADSQTI